MTSASSSSAWSYSSLTLFEQCPKKYYHLRIAKDVVDAPSENILWGNRVHKALEQHARDDTALPAELAHLAPAMAKLKAVPGEKLIEAKIGVSANLEPTAYFGRDIWYRGVVDYGVIGQREALAVDHKTGKKKFDHEQLSLLAAGIFTTYPHVEQVRTAYLWLQTGELTSKTFTRNENEQIWARFIPRVKRIDIVIESGKYAANPSGLCGWCPVNTCPHWVKR